ncbi:MAG: putative peroxidase-related enzyme [Methylophagaceae bacterium]|jgi:uncharacterized peroxidase-related enzyme
MKSKHKLTLSPVTDDSHGTLIKAKKNLGFIPNMYRNMATAPGLLESYLYTYEQFRENADFTPVEQEVVFLTISRENGCTYCMAAHSLIADKMSNVPTKVTDAIRDDLTIPDSKLSSLHAFTKAMHDTRGLPTQADVDAFLAAGYSERNILDIVTAMAVKTMSNFTNHLFHTEVDEAFESRKWED